MGRCCVAEPAWVLDCMHVQRSGRCSYSCYVQSLYLLLMRRVRMDYLPPWEVHDVAISGYDTRCARLRTGHGIREGIETCGSTFPLCLPGSKLFAMPVRLAGF